MAETETEARPTRGVIDEGVQEKAIDLLSERGNPIH